MDQLESVARFRANEIRKQLGLSAFEPVDIIKALQQNEDVSFVLKPFKSGISGMFLQLEATKVIVLSTSRTVGHQKFTAAHEYHHLCFNKETTVGMCFAGKLEQNNVREREADRFAANLLMPADGIMTSLLKRTRGKREITIDDVVNLEQKFEVSRMAMLVRLRQLHVLAEKEFLKMRAWPVIRTARILGYSTDLYRCKWHN